MAIAHVCMRCGLDLARIRARVEPIYHLPLVTCPRCGTHSVRRRHPIWQTYRTLIRVDAALAVLLLQIVMLVGLLAANVAGAVALGELLVDQIGDWHLDGRDVATLCGCCVGVPLLTGAWLTAGLHHWDRIHAWSAFLALVLAALVAGVVLIAGEAALDFRRFDRVTPAIYIVSSPAWLFDHSLHLLLALSIAPLMMAVAAIGIPFGQFLVRFAPRFRARRWRWRRRQRRLGRLVV